MNAAVAKFAAMTDQQLFSVGCVWGDDEEKAFKAEMEKRLKAIDREAARIHQDAWSATGSARKLFSSQTSLRLRYASASLQANCDGHLP